MVNVKENIGHYIQNPTDIQKEDLESIHQLAERYPFCSTLSILLLEGYHQFDFVAYEKFLSQAAILAPDRARLHSILEYQNDQTALENEVEASAEVVEATEETAQKTEEIVDEISVPEERVETLEATSRTSEQEQEEVNETEEVEEEKTEELVDHVSNQEEVKTTEEKEESVDTTDDKEYDHFEKELIASAISSSILSEVEDDESIQYKPFSNKKETFESEDQKESLSDEGHENVEEPQPESFIQFLRKVSKKDTQSKVDTTEKTEIRKSSSNEETQTSSKKDVVDAFIQNPEQKKSKKSFFSPTENAKKSLEENIDNVSETLAKIHELQGNYGKAIQSYEKLILKFPEKKSFFANRIEELKKK